MVKQNFSENLVKSVCQLCGIIALQVGLLNPHYKIKRYNKSYSEVEFWFTLSRIPICFFFCMTKILLNSTEETVQVPQLDIFEREIYSKRRGEERRGEERRGEERRGEERRGEERRGEERRGEERGI